MSDVKRLLDEADLPWGIEPPSKERATLAHIIRAHETGPQVANVLLEQDAALIVHAVNRLPDYEAAVDALERLVFMPLRDDFPDGGDIVLRWEGNRADWENARAVLRRLREGVPA